MNEREIFLAALEKRSGAERTAYVHELCGADGFLRQRVEALLRADAAASEALAVDGSGKHNVAGAGSGRDASATTSVSLLERLRRAAEPAAVAWKRFVELYSPLLYNWARRLGLQPADAADLVQDILTLLVQKMPQFRYEQGKSFRAWLWTVSLNKWRENRRKRVPSPTNAAGVDVPDPAAGDPAIELAEAEYRGFLIRRAQQLMQAEFPATTWKAYWEHVVGGKPANAVAAELGITVNAVYVAKCRVLRHLREELAGLLE